MTKHDKIIERLDTIVSRLDETNSRIDSMNERLTDTNSRIYTFKKDLSTKIDNLKVDFDTQFQNHLSEHAQFKERTFKTLKWILAPTGLGGVVLGILKLFKVV